MKFQGKNFQAWPEFEIDLNGFVVLVGPSFAGKSALFRALKGLLRNEIPAQRVRNGAEAVELSLTIGEKIVTARRKVNGSTKYWVDGQEYSSLAKGLPEGLTALNAGEIKIGDYTVDPIFASQFGDQFMLETSGPTELNTILGAFASTEKLEVGKKQANLLITQKNSEARTLAVEIGDAEERKDRLSKLIETGLLVETALRTMEPKIRHSEAVALWLGQLTLTLDRLVPLRQIAASLAIPDTTEAERLQQKLLYLRFAAKAQKRVAHLKQTDAVLEQAVDEWNKYAGLSRQMKTLTDAAKIAHRISTLHHLDVARKLNDLIGKLEQDLSTGVQHQDSIKYMNQTALLMQRVAGKRAELAQLDASVKELQTTHGLCPKCGSPLEHVCGT